MAGTALKKRSRDDTPKAKPPRPTKKQRKQALDAYHSDSDADADADEFPAVDLLDSDSDDIHNARADDGGATDSGSDSDDSAAAPAPSRNTKTSKSKAAPSIARDAPQSKLAHDAPPSHSDSSEPDDNDEYSDLSASDASDNDDGTGTGTGANRAKLRAKRNDPAAFATSLSKILSTKLSTTRRADPVLARSAAAHAASRQAVDAALESKARKQLRTAKRAAMERGRVRDVLVATNSTFGGNVNPVTGEIVLEAAGGQGGGESTGQVLETEKRLRKVAQRGVVQLFNAFRTAQVKAAEAERGVRKEGVIGVDRKKEKVTEMSKKGFLDLIASGGGGLKKGPLEEA